MFTTTLLSSLVLTACSFKEQLPEKDISGKVILPAAALTRDVVSATDPDGDGVFDTLTTQAGVTDTRLIGPIYLGAFAGIDDVSYEYAHPRMGPVIEGEPGNTFPYGGTTVGRMDFACYESIKCKVTTGRFKDYEDLLDYFENMLGLPVLDRSGAKVEYANTFQQYCYDYFYYTSDAEMSFLGADDFVLNEETGDYEAPFTMAHTILEEGQELNLWGWMDAPQLSVENTDINGSFSTCDSSGVGRVHDDYEQSFTEGRVFTDLLNKPSAYITEGDWIADGSTTVRWDPDGEMVTPESPEVRIDFQFTSEEE